ncbi:UNVERIFIED_CONTAM: hypothetical protein FKN15_002998 [Acipenser sinensis]
MISEQVSAQYQDCCMSYSKKPLPCRGIRGYSIQSVKDLCNIEAVILLTQEYAFPDEKRKVKDDPIVVLDFSVCCCYSYSIKPLHCSRIRGYTIQTTKDACNIDAIVFHSVGNRNICANPLDKWVMDRIECLNRRVDRINGRTRK